MIFINVKKFQRKNHRKIRTEESENKAPQAIFANNQQRHPIEIRNLSRTFATLWHLHLSVSQVFVRRGLQAWVVIRDIHFLRTRSCSDVS